MATEYCDRYDYYRAHGRYPEDETTASAVQAEPVVTAKVVTAKPKRSTTKTTQVADTKQQE